MQRTLPLILVAVLALGVAGILTRTRPTAEHKAAAVAYQMLDLPLELPDEDVAPDASPAAATGLSLDSPAASAGPPVLARARPVLFWRAFLEGAVEPPTAPGQRPTLRLGEVRADPQASSLSARAAGELLALPARPAFDAEPRAPTPLWRVLLEGPAAERDPRTGGVRIRIFGCRHSADPAFHPMVEESYYARLAIADALQELAADAPEFQPLVVEGRELPGPIDRPGLNFDVQLMGPVQAVTVTTHRIDSPPLHAQRPWSAVPPNDAAARNSLVEGLRQRAGTDPTYAELRIEGVEEPEPGGIDLRLEYFGEHQALKATLRDGRTLKVSRAWVP